MRELFAKSAENLVAGVSSVVVFEFFERGGLRVFDECPKVILCYYKFRIGNLSLIKNSVAMRAQEDSCDGVLYLFFWLV